MLPKVKHGLSLIQDTLSLDLVNTCAWTTIDTTVWLIWYPKVTCIFVFFDIFTRILWWCCKFSINPRFDKEMTRLKNHRNCVEQSIFYFVIKKLKMFGAMDNLIFYGFSDQSIFPWNRGLKKRNISLQTAKCLWKMRTTKKNVNGISFSNHPTICVEAI